MTGELLKRNKNEENKRYSIIHWQTGEPEEEDNYIVTYENGVVDFDIFMGINGWTGMLKVTAWCKLSDIEPYKENQP